MNEQTNVAYPFDDTIFSYKKEWNTDTHYSMTEPWKHGLTERSQTRQATYWMIPFLWNDPKR